MTMVPNRMNDAYVSYFPISEYVDRIRLLPNVLEHLEDTNHDFINYFKKMLKYDESYIIDYWIYLQYKELKFNQKVENLEFDKINLIDESIFFNTLNISHKRIHELHNFAIKGQYDPTFSYRNTDVRVSRYNGNGEEEIFWRGANYQDVDKFMNDFIKIYKQKDISILMSNPFLKSALIHLLFLRIHPYTDGNGRTARLLHNSKFTESINNIYGTKLKISPLTLSGSIYLNKPTYANIIDSIYFDLDHDYNDELNVWFNFILNMADEQIFYSSNKLDRIDDKYLKEVKEDIGISGEPDNQETQSVKKLQKILLNS